MITGLSAISGLSGIFGFARFSEAPLIIGEGGLSVSQDFEAFTVGMTLSGNAPNLQQGVNFETYEVGPFGASEPLYGTAFVDFEGYTVGPTEYTFAGFIGKNAQQAPVGRGIDPWTRVGHTFDNLDVGTTTVLPAVSDALAGKTLLAP